MYREIIYTLPVTSIFSRTCSSCCSCCPKFGRFSTAANLKLDVITKLGKGVIPFFHFFPFSYVSNNDHFGQESDGWRLIEYFHETLFYSSRRRRVFFCKNSIQFTNVLSQAKEILFVENSQKSPKSPCGGISPNLLNETFRASNSVWKIGITSFIRMTQSKVGPFQKSQNSSKKPYFKSV